MMSQNRFSFSTRFSFAILSPELNAAKSFVISSAIEMKSQHDPKIKLKIGIQNEYVAEPPAYCESHAIGYPIDVFQSNGNLI